jgi:hypothetical protein
VTNFAGVQLLPATGIERRRIPSSAANYQVSAEVRIEAFNIFRRAGVPRGVDSDLWVPDGHRAHCLFMTQHVYLSVTPLGAHAIDVLIRTFASQHGIPPHPIPPAVLGEVTLAMLNHRLPSPEYCNICGNMNHGAEQCAQRDTFYPTKPIVRTKNASATKAKKVKGKGSTVLCQTFMRPRNGQCKHSPCGYSHLCPYCGGKKVHKKPCHRP